MVGWSSRTISLIGRVGRGIKCPLEFLVYRYRNFAIFGRNQRKSTHSPGTQRKFIFSPQTINMDTIAFIQKCMLTLSVLLFIGVHSQAGAWRPQGRFGKRMDPLEAKEGKTFIISSTSYLHQLS